MAKEKYLVLDNDGFLVKEERFKYDQVTATEFYYVQTQKRQNFGAAGIDHNVSIAIYVDSQPKPIRVNTGPKFFTLYGFSLGQDSTESVIAKFNEISKRTFARRADKYLGALAEHNYFDYDGKRILKDGDIQSDKWTASFRRDAPWLKRPFSIYYEKKPGGFFRSALKYEINTLRDSDVFFTLLAKLFGLSWR